MSSVFDFKAINQRCREISSSIFGNAGDMLMDCPCCEEAFIPGVHDEYDRCNYCNGTHKKTKKELQTDGYIDAPDPPVNCVVCMDQGYQIKQQGLGNYHVPCGCPAGAKWAKSQAVAAQSLSGGAGKAPTPQAGCAQKSLGKPWPKKSY